MVETATVAGPRLTGEYEGLTSEQQKALRRHRDAYLESWQYCKPYFDKALRHLKLYEGVLPPELDCTFSRVMLPLAFTIVQNELPRTAATVLSEDEFFDVVSHNPDLEESAEGIKHWLYYIARTQNCIFPRILPTLERVGIIGTGYRAVTHEILRRPVVETEPEGHFAGIPYGMHEVEKTIDELAIVAQNVDFFSILPAPNGSIPNTRDNDSEEAVEWLHWIQYMSRNKLEAMKSARFANGSQITRMLAKTPAGPTEMAIDQTYKRELAEACGSDNSAPGWMTRIRSKREGLEGRYRCVWTFFRDQWVLIGEDRYVLYAGNPLLDWFPIAKYVDSPNLGEWFGKGLIETCEDVIIVQLLNVNSRLDYMTNVFRPATWMSDSLLKTNTGNAEAMFYPGQVNTFTARSTDDIRKAIFRDRYPEISPQTFMEETGLKQYMMEATGQPNYMKGMGGGGALANETATGIVSLIEEGTARSSMRALSIEYMGLQDELKLMLKLGKKYEWQNRRVRLPKDYSFKPNEVRVMWRTIMAESIDDQYGIELRGTRSLVHKNQLVKNMLSIMPLLVNNPNVPGQKEMLSQAMKASGAFTNIDKILAPEQSALPPQLSPMGPGGQTEGAPGNALGAGTPTVQNDMQSIMGEMGGGRSRQAQPAGAGRFAL